MSFSLPHLLLDAVLHANCAPPSLSTPESRAFQKNIARIEWRYCGHPTGHR